MRGWFLYLEVGFDHFPRDFAVFAADRGRVVCQQMLVSALCLVVAEWRHMELVEGRVRTL